MIAEFDPAFLDAVFDRQRDLVGARGACVHADADCPQAQGVALLSGHWRAVNCPDCRARA